MFSFPFASKRKCFLLLLLLLVLLSTDMLDAPAYQRRIASLERRTKSGKINLRTDPARGMAHSPRCATESSLVRN